MIEKQDLVKDLLLKKIVRNQSWYFSEGIWRN